MLDESNKKSYRLIVIIPWSSILRLISSLTIIILRKLSLVLSKERFSCASFSSVGNRYAASWKHHFRVVFCGYPQICTRKITSFFNDKFFLITRFVSSCTTLRDDLCFVLEFNEHFSTLPPRIKVGEFFMYLVGKSA